MGELGRSEQNIRFGTFEVDRRAGELRKGGTRIKLQEQPFKVLTALLERPGEIVTREELRNLIWPHEAFGDSDHAVNSAIGRLRSALGDSADAPRLIETLHGRGYRFILPITGRDQAAIHTGPDIAAASETPSPEVSTASTKLRWIWASAISALTLTIAVTFVWLARPVRPPRVISTTQLTYDRLTKTGVLTDGSRLYITETTGSKQVLVQTSAAGGETSLIPTPFDNIVMSDVSHDHSEMLVADAAGPDYHFPVWVLPLPSGPPRRLGDIVARCDTWSAQGCATWSPNGRQLAFAKGSEIYMANADGSNIRQLVGLSGYASEIRFAPDGTHLRFTLRSLKNNMSSSIWDVRTDGTQLHPVLSGWRSSLSQMNGDWSPDGRYYFFTTAGAGDSDRASIWAMREPVGIFSRRPSQPVELTTGPMAAFFNGISPDGRRIFAGGWTARSELVRYDAPSRQFVPFLGGLSIMELDFSRDGQWVAYVSNPERTLWRSRVDGSERLQLTSTASLRPRWSPDGGWIAFVNEQAGPSWKIFLVPSRGGTPQELLSENDYQMDPNWSSDGKQLVFGRVPWLSQSPEKIGIQVLDLHSKQLSVIRGSEKLFAPRWSPDGKYLAAVSSDGKKLLRYEFKTKKWTDWIRERGIVSYPTWSTDGKYIYYDNTSIQNPSYRRVKLWQTRSEFLIDLKDLHRGGTDPAAAALGPWSGLAPDGSLLFGRNLSSDEVYALEVELP